MITRPLNVGDVHATSTLALKPLFDGRAQDAHSVGCMLTPSCDDPYLAALTASTDPQQTLVGFTDRLILGLTMQVDFV